MHAVQTCSYTHTCIQVATIMESQGVNCCHMLGYGCFVRLQGLVHIRETKLGTFGAPLTAFEGLPFSSLRSSGGGSWEGAGSWCVCDKSDRV